MAQIEQSTIQFLKDLKTHNYRPWFQENKHRYEKAKMNIQQFLKAVEIEMNKTDDIEAAKLFRIYRDVRFSKDKTPYKTNLSMSLKRRKPFLRGGYYISIGAEEGLIGCGFWNPNSADLKLIRSHIAQDDQALRKVIASRKFKKTFQTLDGNRVKTAPKGFSRDHPAIELLRYKQFLVSKKYTKTQILSDEFHRMIVSDFKAVRPFFDYMSDILTHDLNGVPIY